MVIQRYKTLHPDNTFHFAQLKPRNKDIRLSEEYSSHFFWYFTKNSISIRSCDGWYYSSDDASDFIDGLPKETEMLVNDFPNKDQVIELKNYHGKIRNTYDDSDQIVFIPGDDSRRMFAQCDRVMNRQASGRVNRLVQLLKKEELHLFESGLYTGSSLFPKIYWTFSSEKPDSRYYEAESCLEVSIYS